MLCHCPIERWRKVKTQLCTIASGRTELKDLLNLKSGQPWQEAFDWDLSAKDGGLRPSIRDSGTSVVLASFEIHPNPKRDGDSSEVI